MKILQCEPIYTGGGIYVFVGKTENVYFIADGDNYDVRLLDANPQDDLDNAFCADWQDEHLIIDLDHADALVFFRDMLTHVIACQPGGNYLMSDMIYMLNDVTKEVRYDQSGD